MARVPFLEFIADRVALFDGGMGSELYNRGVFINRCYEEINVSQPALVRDVHASYAEAGADVIQANTWAANRFKLQPYGHEELVDDINYKGVKLAREVAGDDLYVAATIGPLGIRLEPWGPTSLDEARQAWTQQVQALLDGGADMFVLESFEDLAEIQQCILAVRALSDLPIICCMETNLTGELTFGTPADVYTKRLDQWGADIIGLSGIGPPPMLSTLEKMVRYTQRPRFALPAAGLPQNVDGRLIYMTNPSYMAEYAMKFVEVGCRCVGGASGVSPDCIKAMRVSIRSRSPGMSAERVFARISAQKQQENGTQPPSDAPTVATADKSRFARRIADGHIVTSIEITPPRGADPSKVLQGAAMLKEAGVDAINVPDGPRAAARMSAMAMAILIEQKVGIESVLHYCCRDRNMLGMMSDLLGLYAVGLRNILVITGDPPKMGDYPDSTPVFDVDAIGLTNIVSRLNHGIDPGGNQLQSGTAWHIGVGANPAAVDMETELRRFEWKVKAGAEYAITQPVFDTKQLFTFLENIQHVKVPIIAGIWPLVSYRNAEFMNNEVPGVEIPEHIMKRMAAAQEKGKDAALEEGLAIALEMVEEVKPHVQGIQVSAPFGRVKLALQVLRPVME
ncbi:MAG: bifunctional homocysteine S-methyltransferase/methylenetetrahydrofolate reductase [Planctomycetota bacterium]